MQYELVSRALAYVSCFSTTCLFLTAMAIAAANVGTTKPSCAALACHQAIAHAKTSTGTPIVRIAEANQPAKT